MKKIMFAILILTVAVIPVICRAAVVGTYSMALAQDPDIVMVDSTATLELTITNTTASGSASIGWARLDLDPSLFYVSLANLAPAGWIVAEIKNAGAGQSYIIYEATTGALAPGQSETFEMVVTGATDGPFIADVNDMVDNFDAVLLKEDSRRRAGTFTGTAASWTRYSLKPSLTATPASVGTLDLITVQLALINRSTVTQASIAPVAPTVAGTGAVILASGPVPLSASIDPGEVRVFTYTYQAVSTGTVAFTSRGTNGILGSGAVSSPWVTSNTVYIGDFTAQVELFPAVVINGQTAQVKLTLKNNGSTALPNVVPHITTSGSASMTLDSGPTPAGAGALNPGATKTFTWDFTVTGSVGDTFDALVWGTSATATSNTARSDQGEVSAYSGTVYPDNVTSGSTNVSFTYTVFNNGGLPVQKIRISTPSGWTYQSATPPAGWGVGTGGNPIEISFTTGSNYIPVGGYESFVVTFSSVPVVLSDTPYNFLVEIWDTGQNQLNRNPRGAVETIIVVTPYTITVSCTDPDGPPGPVADGYQYYDVLATLQVNSVPVQGANVLFDTTAGALGNGNVVTDAGGQAANTLTGPLSTLFVSATVSAQYLGASASVACPFDPYGGLALEYIPGSLGPVSATAGSTGIVFTLSVINTGTANIDLDEGATYFTFDDATVGGTSSYQAYLDISSPALIPPGGSAVLTFLAADVDAGFSPGSFLPQLFLDDGITSGTRPVTDPVTITGGGTTINIIRWRETIQ